VVTILEYLAERCNTHSNVPHVDTIQVDFQPEVR